MFILIHIDLFNWIDKVNLLNAAPRLNAPDMFHVVASDLDIFLLHCSYVKMQILDNVQTQLSGYYPGFMFENCSCLMVSQLLPHSLTGPHSSVITLLLGII